MKSLIEEYINLVVESKVRQANLSHDRMTEWGDDDHISDLETRIADATYWRDKYPKGSERRSHYRNIVGQLKRELSSAKRHKQKLNEKQKTKNEQKAIVRAL